MKDSFLISTGYYEQIKALSVEQRGILFTAIMAHECGDDMPELDAVTNMAFLFIKKDLDENRQRYEEKCKANAANGAKGGRPKKSERFLEKPSESEKSEQFLEKPKKADNDNEYDNDNDINNILSGKSRPYQQIIDYLNQKTGKRFRVSKEAKRCINARFDDGFTLDDFKKVIDNKCAVWKDDPKMDEYLRPITLFSTKFESYLQERSGRKVNKNRFNNFENSQKYDFAAIEAAALNR